MSPNLCRSSLFGALCLAAVSLGTAASGDVARRISVRIAGDTLQDAVPRIGREAGVSMRCGENSRERRIYLVAKDRPLPEIMGQLKKTMAVPPGTAIWFRSGSGSIFDEDIASRHAREKAAHKKYKERLEAGRAALEEMEKWADFGKEKYPQSTADMKAHIRKYKVAPIVRWQVGAWIKALRALPRDVQDRALLGLVVRVPGAKIPLPCMTALVSANLDNPHSSSPVSQARKRRMFADIRRMTLVLGRSPGAPERLPSLSMVLQEPGKLGGTSSNEILVKPTVADSSGSPDYGATYKSDEEKIVRRGPEEMEKIGPLQARLNLPAKSDGDVTAEILLPAIALAAGRPLIGEFDPCADQSKFEDARYPRAAVRLLSSAGKEMPLWEMLEDACRELDLYWDYRDGWLVITSPRREMGWAGWLDLSPTRTGPGR